jgi:hypothetical protein
VVYRQALFFAGVLVGCARVLIGMVGPAFEKEKRSAFATRAKKGQRLAASCE